MPKRSRRQRHKNRDTKPQFLKRMRARLERGDDVDAERCPIPFKESLACVLSGLTAQEEREIERINEGEVTSVYPGRSYLWVTYKHCSPESFLKEVESKDRKCFFYNPRDVSILPCGIFSALPPIIRFEVLLKLPWDALIRFGSTCKELWYGMLGGTSGVRVLGQLVLKRQVYQRIESIFNQVNCGFDFREEDWEEEGTPYTTADLKEAAVYFFYWNMMIKKEGVSKKTVGRKFRVTSDRITDLISELLDMDCLERLEEIASAVGRLLKKDLMKYDEALRLWENISYLSQGPPH